MQATTTVTATQLRRSTGTWDWLQAVWPPLLTFVLAIGVWEAMVRLFGIPIYLLPAPSEILVTFLERPAFLLGIGMVTFSNALIGCAVGCSLGVLVAAFCVRWPLVADGLVPLSVAASAVPIIALSPLMGIWLGSISPASKIAVVAVMTFFPTMVSVYAGLISPRADAIQLLHSYAAPQRDIFLKLRVPAAMPFFFNALRICATLSMIGAVVAEFFGGPRNALGVYIKTQAGILRTREAWSAILVACLLGLAFYLAIVLIERWALPWKRGRE